MQITPWLLVKILYFNSLAGVSFAIINLIAYAWIPCIETVGEEGKKFHFYTALLLWPQTAMQIDEDEHTQPFIEGIESWIYILLMGLLGPFPKIIFNIFPICIFVGITFKYLILDALDWVECKIDKINRLRY